VTRKQYAQAMAIMMAGVAIGDSTRSNLIIAVLAAAHVLLLLCVLAQTLDVRLYMAWPRHMGGGLGGAGGAVRGYVVPRPRAFGNGTVFDFVLTADVRNGTDADGAAVYFVGPSALRWHSPSFFCSFQVTFRLDRAHLPHIHLGYGGGLHMQ